ncbi:hypothetical protein [Megasphaera sp.]|uniref:hypothetical protein n=1 Tax=Megasphaera sp. TaxID=2023260 RepID=UPI0034460FCF
MKKIKTIGQTGQAQQKQDERAEKAKRPACFPAVGSQLQKNHHGGKKDGRKDKVISDITLEKSRKAGEYQTIGQQPEKRNQSAYPFSSLLFSTFWEQNMDKDQRPI